ncbi:MAG: MFS transporter [Candidatus Methanomethylicaceae archaeon]
MDRILRRFYSGVFTISVGFGIMTPAVPLLATLKFSANEWELGVLGTLVAAPYVFAPFLFGKISDRIGRHPLVLLGISIYLSTSFFYLNCSELYQIAPLRILEGIAFSMIWPSTEAFLGDITDRDSRHKAIAVYSLSWSSGYMVGSFIVGFILSFMDISSVFMVTLLIMILGIIVFFPIRAHNKDPDELLSVKPPRVYLLGIFYVMFIWGFSLLSFFSLFPSYATKSGVQPSVIGYLVGTAGLMRTLVFFSYQKILAFFGKNIVPLGMLSLCISMLISWAMPSTFGFAISVSLLGISLGIIYAYSLEFALSLPSRGSHAGIFESSIGFGELVGPIMMGSIGFAISSSFPYLCLSILTGASSAIAFLIIARG